MRRLGLILFVIGAGGFYYCSQQLAILPEPPLGLSVEESLRYPAGRYQVAEYAAALCGAMGVIFMMFPKGR